jgi:hypothetical protein
VLLALEPVAVELQGPAVLGHRTDYLVCRPKWEPGLDLDRHRDFSTHLTRVQRAGVKNQVFEQLRDRIMERT